MGLEDKSTIDIMTKSLEGLENGLELHIVDSGEVTDEMQRYRMLVEKVGTYLGFIMSAEFARDYPTTRPVDVVIRVLCKQPPNEAMQQVQAVFPRGDRTNRVRVIYEDLDEFLNEGPSE